jgi:hypothetical protein
MEGPMCDMDLGAQFDVIATQPEAASEQLSAVSQRSTDQLRSAAESTQGRPTMATNRFGENAAGHVSGSSHLP